MTSFKIEAGLPVITSINRERGPEVKTHLYDMGQMEKGGLHNLFNYEDIQMFAYFDKLLRKCSEMGREGGRLGCH